MKICELALCVSPDIFNKHTVKRTGAGQNTRMFFNIIQSNTTPPPIMGSKMNVKIN